MKMSFAASDLAAAIDLAILYIAAEYIFITYAFGLIYKFVGWKNSIYIQRNFGWTGYCILGSVGVTYHELSHMITAVIFKHKINEVKLFRPFQGKADGTLGYVSHSWNKKSLFQKIGNFFIGTSPMLFGAGLLFAVLIYAYPHYFVRVAGISEIPGSLWFALSNMFGPANLLTPWTVIVLLITIFICPHMHMSWADVKGATSGAVAILMVALFLSFAAAAAPAETMALVEERAGTFIAYYIYALTLGLIMSLAMTMCFGLLSLVRGKGL